MIRPFPICNCTLRWCAPPLLLIILLLIILLLKTDTSAADFEAEVLPYIQRYCWSCHSAEKQEGDFRIDSLSRQVGIEHTAQWAEVMERISSAEMPPPEHLPLPSSTYSARIVEWLAEQIQQGEAARLAQRGPVSYNRLSREEYVNTVRDLLGVHFDATDPGGFTEDPEWRGIERIGSVLTLSPSNIEKYLSAGETILAEAYPSQPTPVFETTKRAILTSQIAEHHRQRLEALGLLDKVRFEMWPGDVFRYSISESLPAAGIYEISYTLSGLRPPGGRAPRLFVYEKSLDRVLLEQDILAPEDAPITVSFRAHLPKGRPSIDVINEVPGPSNNPRSGRHGNRPFISTQDGRIPWQIKLTDEQGLPRYPFLIMDSISFRGPLITTAEQARRDEYMPAVEGDLEQVRAGLSRLAQRAFRRPVSEAEVAAYVAIVEQELVAGESFRDAVKAGMLAILCSQSFLFITEGDPQAIRHQLNDWEIACRLSYLLWSTMPDDELFRLAEQGKLRDKAVLKQQLKRMLGDPIARRFSDSFSSQWLNLKKVGMFQPDSELYPDYDRSLEHSMVAETTTFFHEVLTQNLSLAEFIDSQWTMLNSRLAEYYSLTDVSGSEFQRVQLPADAHRGGILTHASILSLTSDGTRHRPVHRGKWIAETIFGRTPPPPPANVEPIATNPVDLPKSTLRMKLEAHAHDSHCAACHRKIDPLGFAFENYDAVGRWRITETVAGTGDPPKVDPSGELPDGRSFQSPKEFKQLLLQDMDEFDLAFVEKLATYGLRRSMSFEDRSDLMSIAQQGRQNDYRLRDRIEAFVLSDLFQKR